MDTKELQNIAAQVRRDIIRMVHGAKSGHPGGSLGCADFLTTLFFQIMDIDPAKFTREGTGEDMFFLSNGHISPVLYSVMARRGYFPVEELGTFRKLHTRLQGHPTPVEGLPGEESERMVGERWGGMGDGSAGAEADGDGTPSLPTREEPVAGGHAVQEGG